MAHVNRMIVAAVLCIWSVSGAQVRSTAMPGDTGTVRRMSLDVKDTDIRDVVRMVSKAYDLSIVLDNSITGKVTVHLSDVPIMEGLRTLAESNGLDVTREGSVYRLRKKSDSGEGSIRFARNKLTIDVSGMDVIDFIKELSTKTSVSIVPDSKVAGKLTGKLFEVELDDGIRAILEGNGFMVVRRRNIYQVTTKESVSEAVSSRRSAPRPGGGDFFVDWANERLTIEVTNGNLEDVLKAISEQSDVQLVTYGSVKAEVNAKLFDRTLTEAFALLLGGTQYTFVEKDGIVLIGDRNSATPSGQALSKSEMVLLKHIKADEVPQILPKNISANNVKVVKEQNGLLVTGTSEDIVQMRDFLATIDVAAPQVRIDAVIVEYKEGVSSEFGLRFWRSRKDLQSKQYQGLPGPATPVSAASSSVDIGTSGEMFKKFFGIENGVLGKIPDDFFLALRWMEQEDKAKILAQPSILTLNGRKATINVDETQYFKISNTLTTGSTEMVDRIQPIKFGISLDITPWISQSGQITAEIAPVVSNATTKPEGGLASVASRTLTTTVRLNDGETLKLGGLINHKEDKGMSKVPFLADIPIIGALFRWTNRTRGKTNLVVYITPHVITPADTVDLTSELRDYDLYLLNNMERKGVARLRERRQDRVAPDSGTVDSDKSEQPRRMRWKRDEAGQQEESVTQ